MFVISRILAENFLVYAIIRLIRISAEFFTIRIFFRFRFIKQSAAASGDLRNGDVFLLVVRLSVTWNWWLRGPIMSAIQAALACFKMFQNRSLVAGVVPRWEAMGLRHFSRSPSCQLGEGERGRNTGENLRKLGRKCFIGFFWGGERPWTAHLVFLWSSDLCYSKCILTHVFQYFSVIWVIVE